MLIENIGISGDIITIWDTRYFSERAEELYNEMVSKTRYEIVLETKPKTIVLQEEIKYPIMEDVIDEETEEVVVDEMTGETKQKETGEFRIIQEEEKELLEEIISIEYKKTEEILEEEIAVKVREIKDDCNKHILAKYSMTDQSNLIQEWLFITATAQAEERKLSYEELTRLWEIGEVRTWIDQRVQKCRDDIALLYNK